MWAPGQKKLRSRTDCGRAAKNGFIYARQAIGSINSEFPDLIRCALRLRLCKIQTEQAASGLYSYSYEYNFNKYTILDFYCIILTSKSRTSIFCKTNNIEGVIDMCLGLNNHKYSYLLSIVCHVCIEHEFCCGLITSKLLVFAKF